MSDRGRNVAIGCLMFPIGGISGAMVAVLISKLVAFFMKAPSCSGIPTCDWYVYAGVGALTGAFTLPALVTWRLLRRAPNDHTERG
jgi:hypothetical protein